MDRRLLRVLTLVLVAVVLAGGACRRGKPEDTTETAAPEPTSSIDSSGDFQLVGSVEQAFFGETPNADLATTTSPPDVEGTVTPSDPGVMRVTIEELSDELRGRCTAAPDDEIKVYWTKTTRFDPSLLDGDAEETMDGRRIGAIGKLFLGPGGDTSDFDPFGEQGALETATPPPAGGNVNKACILVAEQIGTQGAATRIRNRATATPRASASPSPSASPTATPEHTPTPKPTKSPTPKPTSTATSEPSSEPSTPPSESPLGTESP